MDRKDWQKVKEEIGKILMESEELEEMGIAFYPTRKGSDIQVGDIYPIPRKSPPKKQ